MPTKTQMIGARISQIDTEMARIEKKRAGFKAALDALPANDPKRPAMQQALKDKGMGEMLELLNERSRLSAQTTKASLTRLTPADIAPLMTPALKDSIAKFLEKIGNRRGGGPGDLAKGCMTGSCTDSCVACATDCTGPCSTCVHCPPNGVWS